MKIMLIIPPQIQPLSPYLGVPSLTAYLQSKDFNVIQRDFNVEVYDTILTREYLEKIYKRIYHNFEDFDSKVKLSPREQKHYDALFTAKAFAPRLIERIEAAKMVLRDQQDFYNFAKYSKALKDINNALKLISAAYYPTKLEFSWFQMGGYSSKEVIAATQEREKSVYRNL